MHGSHFPAPLFAILALACSGSGDEPKPDTSSSTDPVDTTAPVITLVGDAALTMDEGDVWTDPGATANDDVDGEVAVTVDGAVDAATSGLYTLTYTAVDAAGNQATPVIRSVTVRFPGLLLVSADGTDVVLAGMDTAGNLEERSRWSMAPELTYYSSNHTIFGITMRPDTSEFYVSSFNECGAVLGEDSGCWGNSRIDRFSYTSSSVSWEGLAHVGQEPMRITTIEALTDNLVVTFWNQSDEPQTFTTVTAPGADPISTTCVATIAAGETCTVTFAELGAAAHYINLGYGEVSGLLGVVELGGADGNTWKSLGVSRIGDPPAAQSPCVGEESGQAHQNGYCAPTAMSISSDGSTMYVNDDNDDAGQTYHINDDGTLTYIGVGDRMYLQGIAVNGAGTHVYNGTQSYTLDGEGLAIRTAAPGDGGNATEVVVREGVELLVTTEENSRLIVSSLTDPAAPSQIASVSPVGGARFQSHSQDLSVLATCDNGSVTAWGFDGSDLTEGATLDIPIDDGDCANIECNYQAVNRGVAVSNDGTRAVVATIVVPRDETTADTLPSLGRLTSFVVDAQSLALTAISELTFPGWSRPVLMVPNPDLASD